MNDSTSHISMDGAQWGKLIQSSQLQREEGGQSLTMRQIVDISQALLQRETEPLTGLWEVKKGLVHIRQTLGDEDSAELDQQLKKLEEVVLNRLLSKKENLDSEEVNFAREIILKNPKLAQAAIPLLSKCSSTMWIPLMAALLEGASSLDREAFKQLIVHLNKADYDGNSHFALLFKKSNLEKYPLNRLFDNFLAGLDQHFNVADNQIFREYPLMKTQLFKFAFSSMRYLAVFLQDGDVSSEMKEQLQVQNRGKKTPIAPEARIRGSTTLTGATTDKGPGIENWVKACAFASAKAVEHRTKPPTEPSAYLDLLCEMHKQLTQRQEDVLRPGVTRDKMSDKEVVRAGGNWQHLYCPASLLTPNLLEFTQWLAGEFTKEKNPILLAAQAYERIVSLHPFENGNGRVARLFMDYILERYELPATLLEDVLDARFPLKPIAKSPTEFLKKIVKAINY